MHIILIQYFKKLTMGRSPFFNFDADVEFCKNKPESSHKLKQLRTGQRIRITYTERKLARLYRCVSTYEYEYSSMDRELVIDDCNYDENFNKYGIRCIALRDINIPIENHMYSWFITDDGFIRECEGYGIMYEVVDVEIIQE
jgi:hypothetical protein